MGAYVVLGAYAIRPYGWGICRGLGAYAIRPYGWGARVVLGTICTGGAYRYKIYAYLCIIVIFQSDAVSMVYVGIVGQWVIFQDFQLIVCRMFQLGIPMMGRYFAK